MWAMIQVAFAFLLTKAATLTRVGSLPIGSGGIGQIGGKLDYREFLQTIDLASVATIRAVNQSVTVTGLAIGDIPLYLGQPEGLTADVIVVPMGAPVLAANTLVVRCCNPTAGPIDAASAAFIVGVLRPAA